MTRFGHVLDLMKVVTVVRIAPRSRSTGASLWAQLDLSLPGGIKDRVALEMIRRAEAGSRLRAGDRIVESSSGTMAEGLARVGRLSGYRVGIVADPRMDAVTAAKLRALGAELEIVERYDPVGGWQTVRLRRLRALLEQPRTYWVGQYDNPANAAAYAPVGRYLAEEFEGDIEVLVGAVGTGGSLCGTARALRSYVPGVQVVAVDAVGSVLFNQPHRSRLQSGHGNSVVPGNLDYNVIDQVHWVSDGEAFNACRELARRTGIFAGGSSGAAYLVASWIARRLTARQRVVAIFPDRGDRYFATIYSDEFIADHGLSDKVAGDEPVAIRYGIDVAERWSYAPLPHDGGVCYHTPGAVTTTALAADIGLPSPARDELGPPRDDHHAGSAGDHVRRRRSAR